MHRVDKFLDGDTWRYDAVSLEVIGAETPLNYLRFLAFGFFRAVLFLTKSFLVLDRLPRALNREKGIDYCEQAVSRVGEVGLCLAEIKVIKLTRMPCIIIACQS